MSTSYIDAKKNEAYELAFEMESLLSKGEFLSGETVTHEEYYKEGAGAWTSHTISGSVSEIGTLGIYKLSILQAEMNYDQVLVKLISVNTHNRAIVLKNRARDVDDVATTTALAAAQTDLDTLTDSVTQPGQETPPANNTIPEMVAHLYKNYRNKKDQDDTTWQLYNDDATTVDQKATVSKAAGTVTKNEITSGP